LKYNLRFVNDELRKIKSQNLYRRLRFGNVVGSHIIFGKKKLINLCSNDYLGLPSPKIRTGQNQSSSRLVSGNDSSFKVLEKKLAKHKSKESSLIFPTGYMTNLGTISSIIKKDDLILSDKLNHASIIDACKLSGATISIYKHNDMHDLENKVKQKYKRKFVITEGIFSMDGDFAKLKEISEIATKNNCTLVLDDAHGDFIVGKDGKGSAQKVNASRKIDVYISSLSKGLGAFGGYVAARRETIDFLINTARSFIYTSALPFFLVEYALKKFESNRESRREKLWRNVDSLHSGLVSLGYQIDSPSHIIPIIIGSEKKTMEFGRYLFENGVFAQPIRFPTVVRGKARIRVSLTALLSKKDINNALIVFGSAGKKFGIL